LKDELAMNSRLILSKKKLFLVSLPAQVPQAQARRLFFWQDYGSSEKYYLEVFPECSQICARVDKVTTP
jgi:hypothetical protein